MHSFASALIAAAFATLSSAAPVGVVPRSLLLGVSDSSTDLPLVPKGFIQSVDEVIPINARAATLSIAVIFGDLLTDIQPYTEHLTYLVDSDFTVDDITNTVSSIKAPIVAAIPQLKALVGLEASVILAPVTDVVGDVELTVSQVANIVAGDVNLVLGAAGNVLDIATTKADNIVYDVKDILKELGCAVTDLVAVVVPLVDGLADSLAPLIAPVDTVISDLDLNELAVLLHLSI